MSNCSFPDEVFYNVKVSEGFLEPCCPNCSCIINTIESTKFTKVHEIKNIFSKECDCLYEFDHDIKTIKAYSMS